VVYTVVVLLRDVESTIPARMPPSIHQQKGKYGLLRTGRFIEPHTRVFSINFFQASCPSFYQSYTFSSESDYNNVQFA
jgi:hypothetical protein